MALFLRKDFDVARLRLVARESDDADPVRRLLTLAAIYDGMSRAGAAQIGGVTRQIVRDWVVRWRLVDLVQWVWERSAISISRQTLGRGLRAMGSASCRPVRATTRRLRGLPRLLEKLPGHGGSNRAHAGPRSRANPLVRPRRCRGLVRRRGQDRAEEDHPALGQAWHPALRAAGPAHRVHRHLRVPSARSRARPQAGRCPDATQRP